MGWIGNSLITIQCFLSFNCFIFFSREEFQRRNKEWSNFLVGFDEQGHYKVFRTILPLTSITIIRLFITMAILWTVNDFFYVAGTLNAENLSGDIFINFSLISLTEMPSVFIGQFLIGMLFCQVRPGGH